MSKGTKDQIEGAAHEVMGAIKATIGKAIDNPKIEAEGQVEKAAGTLQKKVGEAESFIDK